MGACACCECVFVCKIVWEVGFPMFTLHSDDWRARGVTTKGVRLSVCVCVYTIKHTLSHTHIDCCCCRAVLTLCTNVAQRERLKGIGGCANVAQPSRSGRANRTGASLVLCNDLNKLFLRNRIAVPPIAIKTQ